MELSRLLKVFNNFSQRIISNKKVQLKHFFTFIRANSFNLGMMLLLRLFLTASFFIICSVNATGQPWLYSAPNLKSTPKTLTFAEQQEMFDTYWSNRQIEKGKGYKQFRRWEQFLAPRINQSGSVNQEAYWQALQEKATAVNYDTLNWKYIGPEKAPKFYNTDNISGNGRLNCIAFHPNIAQIIYVGAPSGGLWISEDYGQTWRTTTDKLNAIGISDIVVTTTDTSTVIYIATGDGDSGDTYSIGILKSEDGGETWNPTSLGLSASNEIFFRRLIMHPEQPNIMYATSTKGIYKTEDSWESYSLIQSDHFKDIEFHPNNHNILYATSFSNEGQAHIFISDDGGSTFSIANLPSHSSGKISRIELAVSRGAPNTVHALCASAQDGGFYALYRSTNSGNSWSLLYDNSRENLLGWSPGGTDKGGQGWYDLAMAISPQSPNHIIVGGINNWRSENGGTIWELSSWLYHIEKFEYVHADQHMLAYSPHTYELFAVNDGGIYRSSNYGETWVDISSNLQILQTYKLGSSHSNANKLICGNQDNGTFFYDSEKWNHIIGGDGMYCHIDKYNENLLYASAFNGDLYKSIDGGKKFEKIKPESDLKGAWITPFIIHPQNNLTLYVAYKDIYKSTDAGENWIKISEGLSTENINSLAVAPSNDNYIYAATYNKIYKTTNGGSQWVEVPIQFSELSITSICISPNDANKIWISLSGYNELDKIFYSANGGGSWINYSTGLPNVPVNEVIMRLNSRNELYAATDIGVYYRNSDTSQWVDYSSQLPNVIVSDLEIIDDKNLLRASTYGRGIWEAELPPALLSKANFESDILTGCLNAPINLYYRDTVKFDSLVWNIPEATILNSTINNDTITISFDKLGKKTIQLLHYSNGFLISEVKYEYLDIRDTLDINISPDRYSVCDSSDLNIELRKGYNYSWSPDHFIDTTKGHSVIITPFENITYTVHAQHGTCQTFFKLPIIYMPDDICDAVFLPNGSSEIFENSCATPQLNEPSPPIGTGDNDGCISQDGWCSEQDTIENSLWFKVVVPENGRMRINVSGFDSQIALYKSPSCSELVSGNYKLLAANDDINTTNVGSEIDVLEGLTIGDTLYLQLDGSFDGAVGEFKILVSDQDNSTKDILNELKLYFDIYPNPATGEFTVNINEGADEAQMLEIISQTGSVIYNQEITTYLPNFEITIPSKKMNGLYFVRISTKDNFVIKKLIIL